MSEWGVALGGFGMDLLPFVAPPTGERSAGCGKRAGSGTFF
jgi:hypothetical protein